MTPPLPLDRFSPRAQRLLLAAERHKVARSPAVIARRLTAKGRPALAAAIDFERTFGGLSWGEGSHANYLAIRYCEPAEKHTLGERERTMVPIGQVYGAGEASAYIDESGGIWKGYGGRSASIITYIEQAAMEHIVDWPIVFDALVRPPVGAPLAEALGLSPVAAPSDAYQAWWTSPDIEMRHMLYRDPSDVDTKVDWFHTSSLDGVAWIFEQAARLRPGVGVSLSRAGGTHYVDLTPEERSLVPPIESWRDVPGAVRYPLGVMWDDMTGVVWVLGGPGARRIEEYVTSADGEAREWTTYEGSGEIARWVR